MKIIFFYITFAISFSALGKVTDEIIEQKMLDLRGAVVRYSENPSLSTAEIEARLRSLQAASGVNLPIESLAERAMVGDLEVSPDDGTIKYNKLAEAEIVIFPKLYIRSHVTKKIRNQPTGSVIPFPESGTVK